MISASITSVLLGMVLTATLLSGCTAPFPRFCHQSKMVISASLESSPSEKGHRMRVLWTVSKYIRGPAATWSHDQAQSLVFSPLDIDDSSITFAGRRCLNVVFEREEIQLEEYLAATYGLTPAALELTAGPAQVFRSTCDIPGFAEYLRLPDRRLMIQIEGVFFLLEAAVNY